MTAKSDAKRTIILAAGVKLARKGLDHVNLRAIARVVGMSHTGIYYYFPTIEQLRDGVIAHAIATDDAPALARLILDEHPAMTNLPAKQRASLLARAAA